MVKLTKKEKELTQKIATVNNIPLDKAEEIAKKVSTLQKEKAKDEQEFYLFHESNLKYKGVTKWFAEKQFKGDKKLLGEMSVTFISILAVEEETEKAVKLTTKTPYGESSQWFPKSVLLVK